MSHVTVLGLNHATAPLALREALACDRHEAAAVLRRVTAGHGGEAVLLNTCNRVELYHAPQPGESPLDGVDALAALIGGRPARPGDFAGHTYRHAGPAAADHLFHVASALGSMVLGESQILGQVRQAYEQAQHLGCVGAALHPLFQRAITAGREVLRDTELGGGRASVGGVAVQYAEAIFGDLAGHRVLMIGAGDTGRLVLQSFRQLVGPQGELRVVNRTLAKAQTLATDVGGEAVAWADLPAALAAADVVVSSTAAREAVVTRAMLEPLLPVRRYRPLFLIDLAVPRDIEPAAGELREVYRYDLDDLQRVVSHTLGQRESAVAAARAVVARHVAAYAAWERQRSLGPTIAALYRQQHALAEAELERTLAGMPELTDAQRDRLRRSCRRTVNRLLHAPVTALRERGDPPHSPHPHLPHLPHPHGPGVYRHAVEHLFALGEHQ